MPQVSILLSALVSVACLSVLGWQVGADGRPRPIVLAVLPIALLFLTIPPVLAAIGMIAGFQRVAAVGAGGAGAMAPFLYDFSWSLLWGGLGLLVTMLAAAVMQAWSFMDAEEAVPTDVLPPPTNVHTLILVMVSLFIIPVSYYSYVGGRLPGVVMDVASKAEQGVRVEASEVSETSRMLASALVRAVIGGAALTLVLVACGMAGLVAARRGKPPHWLFTYSWIVLAAAAALSGWGILHASVDLRALERLVQ